MTFELLSRFSLALSRVFECCSFQESDVSRDNFATLVDRVYRVVCLFVSHNFELVHVTMFRIISVAVLIVSVSKYLTRDRLRNFWPIFFFHSGSWNVRINL